MLLPRSLLPDREAFLLVTYGGGLSSLMDYQLLKRILGLESRVVMLAGEDRNVTVRELGAGL